jgi:succinylglutamate desuccinylase
LVSSIPTPIAVPNESAGDTQAKHLFSLFLHHHLSAIEPSDEAGLTFAFPESWHAQCRQHEYLPTQTKQVFVGSRIGIGIEIDRSRNQRLTPQIIKTYSPRSATAHASTAKPPNEDKPTPMMTVSSHQSAPTQPTARQSACKALRELDHIPDGLLDLEAQELAGALGGPTLILLPGQREPALFISVLMHGNETVGWDAMRRLLLGYREQGRALPRAICLFIGNVEAAAAGMRHLPQQPDYNRIWPGSELAPTPEHAIMNSVVQRMQQRGLFASIDLHNNTGANPHYACVNVIDNRFLHLATLFSRTVVYFLRPRGVQSQAMAQLCPAVTLECGKVHNQHGIDHAVEFIDACLHLSHLPDQPVPAHDIDLFHTVAQVKIAPQIDFRFAPNQATLMLSPELERMNFRELPAGTALGRCTERTGLPFEVKDEGGRHIDSKYFILEDGEIRLRLPVMPAMLTCDETIVRQDCLCYLMERYDQHVPKRA